MMLKMTGAKGPVFGMFWASFGQVWASFGQVLCKFWASFVQFLIWSKMTKNGQMVTKVSKLVKMIRYGQKWSIKSIEKSNMVKNDHTWSKMVKNGQIDQNGQTGKKWSKMVNNGKKCQIYKVRYRSLQMSSSNRL